MARSASTCPSKEAVCSVGGICPPNPLTRMPFLPTASSGATWHDFVYSSPASWGLRVPHTSLAFCPGSSCPLAHRVLLQPSPSCDRQSGAVFDQATPPVNLCAGDSGATGCGTSSVILGALGRRDPPACGGVC